MREYAEEFGVIVGRRNYEELEENAIQCRGRIELWNDGVMIVSEYFYSKQHRKTIIDKWDTLYHFNNKRNAYFQIKYR